MRKLWIIGGLLVLAWGLTTTAQQPTWSADFVLSFFDSAERLRITPNGAEAQVLYTGEAGGVSVMAAAASDDGRYFALARQQQDPYRMLPLRIVDSQTGSTSEIMPLESVDAINFAGFEPGGTRVAFSYVGFDPQSEFAQGGGMMVVDAATGQITHQLPMNEVNPDINAPLPGPWAYMDDWTNEGILFTPNCYGCEGVFEESLSAWVPDTGELIADTGLDFSIFGTRLPATNEMLYVTRDVSFPYDPQPGMFPIPNVVQYFPQSDLTTEGTVVYFDGVTARVSNALWAVDGTALLAETRGGAAVFWNVVYRDGQQQRFEGSSSSQAVFGTPDGFVALDTQADGSTNILHYNLLEGRANVIGQIPAGAQYALARTPRLWGDVPGAPLPFAPVPALESAAYQALAAQLGLGCEGFLPSRLRVDEQARVTPGAPNRLREYADVAAPQVGLIPGEGVFTVIDGPFCDPANGIAWWYVDYEGTRGWTAEGQGDEYWTEPLP